MSERDRIPELDGIRGIAIGMVMVYHQFVFPMSMPIRSVGSYLQAAGRLTWSGVDLFFVLSGFLIGGILMDNRESSNYFQAFYIRRFFRIVPAYWLCITLVLAAAHAIQTGIWPRLSFLTNQPPIPWAPHFIFVQNFWMAARNQPGLLGITWSLSIEEQFYLTLPLLIRYLSPARLLTVIYSVIIGAPILRLSLFLLWPGHSWAGFALLPCRADSLMLGVLAAIIMRNKVWRERLEKNRAAMRSALVLFGSGLLVFTKYSFSQHGIGMQTVGFTWLAASYSCFVLYALTARQKGSARLLLWRPLGWLGTVAYSAYLYHGFVLWAVFGIIYSSWPQLSSFKQAGVSLMTVVLTLALSRISWVSFERPLLRLGHRVRYQFKRPAETVQQVPILTEGEAIL